MVRTTTPDQLGRSLPALPMGIRQAVIVWFGAAATLWGAVAAASWIVSAAL